MQRQSTGLAYKRMAISCKQEEAEIVPTRGNPVLSDSVCMSLVSVRLQGFMPVLRAFGVERYEQYYTARGIIIDVQDIERVRTEAATKRKKKEGRVFADE